MNTKANENTEGKTSRKKSKRNAQIDKSRCVACGACVKECPRYAIDIYKGCYAVVDIEKCIGCGKCKAVCPADTIEVIARGN